MPTPPPWHLDLQKSSSQEQIAQDLVVLARGLAAVARGLVAVARGFAAVARGSSVLDSAAAARGSSVLDLAAVEWDFVALARKMRLYQP